MEFNHLPSWGGGGYVEKREGGYGVVVRHYKKIWFDDNMKVLMFLVSSFQMFSFFLFVANVFGLHFMSLSL